MKNYSVKSLALIALGAATLATPSIAEAASHSHAGQRGAKPLPTTSGHPASALTSRMGTASRVAGRTPEPMPRRLGVRRHIVPTAAESNPQLPKSHEIAKHSLGAPLPKKEIRPAVRNTQSTLPVSVDLSSYDVPVGNQGSIGSCVTWAIDYALLGWQSRHDGKPGQPFNPMYTYSQIHLTNAAGGGGSWPSDALSVAQSQGNDTMAHYSHSTTDFIDRPNAAEVANAANFKIAGSQTLFQNTTGVGFGSPGATAIETALANGQPVAIGLQIRDGFDHMSNSATTPDDDISSPSRGGHEVLAVAYDQGGVWVQNSWGTGWGRSGYGYISWRVVGNDVYQAHTITGFALADTTAPTMNAVTQQFALNQQITASIEPVTFQWSASDASGIAAYAVYVKTDSGAFIQDTSVAPGATQVTYALAIGHSYQVAVAAKDGAGNWSGYVYSAAVVPTVDDDTAFQTTSVWGRYPLTGTFGGTYMASSQSGSVFQDTFTGRSVALVAPKFSTAGRATIYCDGSSIGVVDLNSATTVTGQIVAECHFLQSAQHTMKVVVEGTAGHPWFGVDAFGLLQ